MGASIPPLTYSSTKAAIGKCELRSSGMVAHPTNDRLRFVGNSLVQSERNFDRYDGWHNFAVRSDGRLELPSLDRFDGFLFQAEARTFYNGDVDRAPIRSDRHLQHDGTLVFRLARFVRILWDRAVEANRDAHTVDARAKCAAAGAAAFSRTKTAARATANSGAIAVTKRLRIRRGQRIAECRHVRARHLQIRRT